MNLKTVIIDDEISGRETLARLLERFVPDVAVVGDADSMETGIALIQKVKPDLVFLDIEMPDGNGFQLLSFFQKIDFEVIFVTAYNQYAIKAFKFSALDYILKPVNVEELKKSVLKAEEKIKQNSHLERLQMEVLSHNYKQPFSQDNTLALPTMRGMDFVQVKKIIRCQASESYSEIFLEGGTSIVISRKLIEVEEMLKDYRFFRIHKSHLINLNHLVRYTRGTGGVVIMSDGSHIDVAKRKKDDFLKALE